MTAPYTKTTAQPTWTCPNCGRAVDLGRDEPCPHRRAVCWGCCRAKHGEGS